jgi:hypothetical protein
VITSPPFKMNRFAPVWRMVCGEHRTPSILALRPYSRMVDATS